MIASKDIVVPGPGEVTGIQFTINEKGQKIAAVMDLKTHKKVLEDVAGVLTSQSRRHERGIPLEKVKTAMKK